MSFADFASNGATSSLASRSGHGVSTSTSLSLPLRQAVDSATLKLEQFQRQVLAIKRASTASGSVDEDLHDRIRFACLLQGEIAKALACVPADASNSLIKRKLCKDFETISTQLETSVLRVSAREQAQQQALKDQQQDGRIIAEHQGQIFEFAELENEIAHNEALIEEREQDINKIHQSVAQVNEIFRDLAAIVQDQQGAIDDIETHVHESMEQTQHGLNETLELNVTITKLRKRLQYLEQENDDLQSHVRRLEATEQDLTHDIERAQEQVVFTQHELEMMHEKQEQDTTQAMAQLDNVTAKLEEYQDVVARLLRVVGLSIERKRSFDGPNDQSLSIEHVPKTDAQDWRQEVERLRKELASKCEQLQTTEEHYEELMVASYQVEKALVSENTKFKHLVAALQTENTRLQQLFHGKQDT